MASLRGVLFLALLGSALTAYGWEMDKSFEVESGGTLKLRTEQGSIHVDTHETEVVEVRVKLVGFDEDDLSFDFDHDGGDVSVDVDVRRQHGWGQRHMRFTILVPKTYNVDLRTSGGSITVTNLAGAVEANTSGGTLDFENISGDIRGHTSGGSIDVEGSKGSVRVKTSGGSIDISDIEGDVIADTSGGRVTVENVNGDLEAETSGGSMRIEEITGSTDASTSGGSIRSRFSRQPGGDVVLSTSGGSITVMLERDADMSLRAQARRIRSEFRVDGQTEAKRRLSGEINDGGPLLDLHSSSGSIDIERI